MSVFDDLGLQPIEEGEEKKRLTTNLKDQSGDFFEAMGATPEIEEGSAEWSDIPYADIAKSGVLGGFLGAAEMAGEAKPIEVLRQLTAMDETEYQPGWMVSGLRDLGMESLAAGAQAVGEAFHEVEGEFYSKATTVPRFILNQYLEATGGDLPDVMTQSAAPEMADVAADWKADLQEQVRSNMPEGMSQTQEVATDIYTSLAISIPVITGMALTKGKGSAGMTMGAPGAYYYAHTAGEAYTQAREAGLDEAEARSFANQQGWIMTAAELVGVEYLNKVLRAGWGPGLMKAIGAHMAAEGAGSAASSLGMDINALEKGVNDKSAEQIFHDAMYAGLTASVGGPVQAATGLATMTGVSAAAAGSAWMADRVAPEWMQRRAARDELNQSLEQMDVDPQLVEDYVNTRLSEIGQEGITEELDFTATPMTGEFLEGAQSRTRGDAYNGAYEDGWTWSTAEAVNPADIEEGMGEVTIGVKPGRYKDPMKLLEHRLGTEIVIDETGQARFATVTEQNIAIAERQKAMSMGLTPDIMYNIDRLAKRREAGEITPETEAEAVAELMEIAEEQKKTFVNTDAALAPSVTEEMQNAFDFVPKLKPVPKTSLTEFPKQRQAELDAHLMNVDKIAYELAQDGIRLDNRQLELLRKRFEPTDERDLVTGLFGPGFHRPEKRVKIAQRAQEWLVENSQDAAYYIEGDLSNLGGLNKKLKPAGADKVYSAMVQMVTNELQSAGLAVESVRRGGDELAWIVVGPATQATIDQLIKRAEVRIAEYTKAHDLDNIPHTKVNEKTGKVGAPGTSVLLAADRITVNKDLGTTMSGAMARVEDLKIERDLAFHARAEELETEGGLYEKGFKDFARELIPLIDRIIESKENKSFDSSTDTLYELVTKNGGLNRAMLEQAGHSTDKAIVDLEANQNRFRPFVSTNGELSIEDLGELMVQEGFYDERPTEAQVLDDLGRVAGGEAVVSDRYEFPASPAEQALREKTKTELTAIQKAIEALSVGRELGSRQKEIVEELAEYYGDITGDRNEQRSETTEAGTGRAGSGAEPSQAERDYFRFREGDEGKPGAAETTDAKRGRISAALSAITRELGIPEQDLVLDSWDNWPESIRQNIEAQGVSDPYGAYHPQTGKVYINPDAHPNVHQARLTAMHEIVGHYGIHKLFTENGELNVKAFDNFLDDVWSFRQKDIKDIWQSMDKYDPANEEQRRVAVEEFIAQQAEAMDDIPLFQKIYDAIVHQLRKLFGQDTRWSQYEIRNLLRMSKANLMRHEMGEPSITTDEVRKTFDAEMRFNTGVADDPNQMETFDRTLKKDYLGFYSGLEKQVLDMNLPQWKAKKGSDVIPRAKGKDIWAKIKSLPIKKEEVEWLGVEDFLIADPEATFSREDVVTYLRDNGVQVDEVVAVQEGSPMQDDIMWDQGTPYAEEEAWEYRAEDIQADDESLSLEQAMEQAKAEYMDNPYMIYSTVDAKDPHLAEMTIFGNDDIGYTVRLHGLRWEDVVVGKTEEIWSLGEAKIQALEYAMNNDMLLNEDDPMQARWGEYVADGYHENYREVKLTLPELTEDFYNDTHFPDRNIVSFLRVTDREMHVQPAQKHADTYEKSEGKQIGSGKPSYNVMTKRDDQIIDMKSFDTEQERQAFIEQKQAESDAAPKPVNTYFIDEFQSDWHQEGRQKGYSTGEVDAGVLEAEYHSEMNDIREDVNKFVEPLGDMEADLLQAISNIRWNAAGGLGMEFNEIPLTQALTVAVAGGTTTDGRSGKKLDTQSRNNIFRIIKETPELHRFVERIEDAIEKLKQAQAERYGVPNAPFKGDAWMMMGLKRALMQAAEAGYDAFAWADAEVLMDRWSDRYATLYKTQYDKKMPSLVKKITKQQPKHLNLEDGTPVEHEELGYWVIELTPELREEISHGQPLFRVRGAGEGRTGSNILRRAINRVTRAGNVGNSALKGIGEFMFFSSVGRIRDIGTPTAQRLAGMFRTPVSAYDGIDAGPDPFLRAGRMTGGFVQELYQSLEPLRGRMGLARGVNDELVQALRNGQVPTDPRLATAYRRIRKLMNDIHQYAEGAGLDIGFVENYFPRIYDVDQIIADPNAFIDMLVEHDIPQNVATDVMRKIVDEEGVFEARVNQDGRLRDPNQYQAWTRAMGTPGGSVRMSAEKQRVIDVPEDVLRDWLVNDVDAVIANYIQGVTKRAEYVRTFGPNEEILNEMVRDIIVEAQIDNVPISIEDVTDAVYGMADMTQGVYNPIRSMGLRKATRTISAFETVSKLSLVALTSLSEWGFVLGEGGRDAILPMLKMFGDGIQESAGTLEKLTTGTRRIPKSEMRQAAEDMGVILPYVLEQKVANRFSGVSGSAVSGFMKAVFLTQLTNAQRMVGMQAGLAAIKRHGQWLSQNPDRAGSRGYDSRVERLRSMGISPDQAMAYAQSGEFADIAGMAAANLAYRMVQNPRPEDLPEVLNDPHFTLFVQFKRFTASISNTLLKRYIDQARFGRAPWDKIQGLFSAALAGMLAYFSTYLRDFVKWGGEENPYREDDEITARAIESLDRAGVFGHGTYAVSLLQPRYGYVDSGAKRLFNLLGPAASDLALIMDIGQDLREDRPDAASKKLARLIPVANVTDVGKTATAEALEEPLTSISDVIMNMQDFLEDELP